MNSASLAIEHALLGFLRRQPQHGYAVHQQLSDPAGLGPVWRLKLSQLYALLHKLEEAGYLIATLESQESRPPRKVFHLTPAGETAFLDWLHSPVANGRSLRLEFLVKLYFARRERTDAASRLVAAQRAQVLGWLAEATSQATLPENDRAYGRLVHRFRQGQIKAMLAWLDDCEASFGDM
jgi:PadR family transcriptional regulator, regulatory protein AphA